MSHALWLGVSLLLSISNPARGQPLAPARAALAQPKLALTAEVASAPPPLALTPPCLGCRDGLRTATAHYAPEPSPPVPAAQPAPPIKKAQYALGDSWKLGGGRTLSVRLTPSPEECAPLVRLSF